MSYVNDVSSRRQPVDPHDDRVLGDRVRARHLLRLRRAVASEHAARRAQRKARRATVHGHFWLRKLLLPLLLANTTTHMHPSTTLSSPLLLSLSPIFSVGNITKIVFSG